MLVQLLAGAGFFSTCRCAPATECCGDVSVAAAKSSCCSSHKASTTRSCGKHKENESASKPCQCFAGKNPDATTPNHPVRLNNDPTPAMCEPHAPVNSAAILQSECRFESRTPGAIPAGQRLQSLFCIWII
jgi:hypothetical protein